MDTKEITASIEGFINKIKKLLNESTKETLFIQYSLDDKGYVWVSRELVPAFEEAIKDKLTFYKYDGEEPIDKMVGQKDYSLTDLVEYAYIPIYDLPYEDLHVDIVKMDPYYLYMWKLYELFVEYERVVKEK